MKLKIIKSIIYTFIAVGCVISKTSINDFPLWGSSWLVAEGDNQRIFASILPLKPNKLAMVSFNSNKSITLHYANLDHRTFRCTADLLDEIKLQFEENVVNVEYDSIVATHYRPASILSTS